MKSNFISKCWQAYKSYIRAIVLPNNNDKLEEVSYWQNELFYNLLIYIAPLSVIALVPSVYMSLLDGVYAVCITDLVVFSLLLLVMLNRSLTLELRKIISISIVYMLSIVLIYFMSQTGAGLLFLLSVTIITAIIYSPTAGFYTAFANAFICIVFAVFIYFKVDIPITSVHSIGRWIAISCNLVFLSFVSANCLRLLLRGLEKYIVIKVAQEEQILQSELRFKALVQDGSDLIGIIDLEGDYKYVSPTSISVLGMAAEEFIGKNAFKYIHPEDRERILTALQKIHTENRIMIEVFRFRNHNNEWRWLETVLTNMLDNPAVKGIVSNSRDITARMKAAEEILKAKRLFQFLSAVNQNIVHSKNEQELLTNTCTIAEDIGKFTLSWIGLLDEQNKLNIVAQSGHAQSLQSLQRFSGLDFSTSPLLHSPQGQVLHTGKYMVSNQVQEENDFAEWKDELIALDIKSSITFPIKKADKVVGVFSFCSAVEHFFDEAEIKLLEEAAIDISFALEVFEKEKLRLQFEEERNMFFEISKDMIGIAGTEGYFHRINPAFEKALGYTADEFCSTPFIKYIHPDDLQASLQEVEKSNKGISTLSFTNRYRCKDGRYKWLEWSVEPLSETLYCTARDITEDRKLRELNRQTRQLAKIGSWEVDMVNQTLYWSEEVHKLHETDLNSFVPDLETSINFYREDFRTLVIQSFGKGITTGAPFDFEAVLVTANKKEVWVRVIGNAEFVDGSCVRIYGSFQDINSLKQTENRLRSFSENIPGVIYQYVIHPDGTDSIQFISGMVEQLWGFTTKEVMGDINLLWNQIKLGGDLEAVKESINKSIQTKSKWTSRFKTIMPNGELKMHLGNAGIPIFLADGSIMLNVIVLDVTQQAKNEELLEDVTKLAKIGSWEVDLKTMTSYFSEETFRIYDLPVGLPPTAEDSMKFYAPEAQPLIKKAVAQAIENHIAYDVELPFVTANHKNIWVRAYGKAEVINGKAVRLYGAIQDITERKEAEENLKKSENKFRSLIENSSDMLSLISADGRILYTSPSIEKKFGYTNEENKMRQVMDVIHPDDLPMAMRTLESVFKNPGVPFPSTVRNQKKDGTYIWVEGTITNMLDVPGVNALVANIRDITERKKHEEQQALFSNIVNSSYDAILSYSIESVIYTWNTGAEKMFGYTAAEIIGKKVYKLIPTHLKHEEIEIIEKIKSENFIEYYETERQKKNGEIIFVSITVSPIKDSEGNIIGASKILRDITERKKHEQDLEHSEARLNEAQAIAHIGNWEIDLISNNHKWSNEMCSIFGVESQKPTVELFLSFIHPEDRAFATAKIGEAFQTYSNSSFNFRFLAKNGTVRYAYSEFKFEFDANKKPLRLYGILQDITERKKAEEKIKFHAYLLSIVGQATIATDINGKVTFWNNAAEIIYGWKEEEAMGQNIMDLTTSSETKEQATQILEQLYKGNSWAGDFKVTRKDGLEFPVHVTNSPIYNEMDELIGIIGISFDLTEHKKAEEEIKLLNESLEEKVKERTLSLQEANNELETFSYTVSHDLQSPLRSLSGFSKILMNEYSDKLDDDGKEFLEIIDNNARRMSNLIRDLLDFAKTGKEAVKKGEVDMYKLAKVIVDEIQFATPEFKTKIIFGELKPAFVDAALMRQVFSNLIGNAVKYSAKKEQPVVEIGMQQINNEEVYFIKDNGAGFEMKYARKLFGVFQRMHGMEEFEGTGVGLATVHRIISKHGGRIWAEAEKGIGATFYFTLPKS